MLAGSNEILWFGSVGIAISLVSTLVFLFATLRVPKDSRSGNFFRTISKKNINEIGDLEIRKKVGLMKTTFIITLVAFSIYLVGLALLALRFQQLNT